VPKTLDQLGGELADADSIVTTTSLGLQQKGREALPGPLSLSAKYCYLQEIYKWAMLDLNQRPPPCKGDTRISPGAAGDRKTP
jgi:hypothetical protein